MPVPPSADRHVLLHLDLATENQVPTNALCASLEATTPIRQYRMTEFGAEQKPYGSRDTGWHLWARSFEEMLRRARRECEDVSTSVRYHVVGRAALPMATYAGLALSSAASVTVHNPRRKTPHLDSIDLEQPAAAIHPRFFIRDRVGKMGDPTGPIALCVSMGQPITHTAVTDFLARQGSPCAAVAYLSTPASDQAVLDAEHAPAVIWQLTRRLLDLRRRHDRSRGLIVFCAGPVSLALTVGWAINPRIYGPIWLPNYDSGVYKPALHFPMHAQRRHKARILLLTAAPQNEGQIDLQVQHRAVEDALKPVSRRCELVTSPGLRGRDIADKLRELSPDIVHILAHGTDKGGVYAVAADPGMQSVEVIQREIVEALQYGDPPPRLVLLHVCSAGVTAEQLAQHFDVTIGATAVLWQDTAAAFSTEFYSALADGLSVRSAYARTMLNLGILEQRGLGDLHAYYCPTGDQGEWTPFPAG
jgi:hypothetical protein